MKNYYNSLSREEQLKQLGQCDFLDASEFVSGTKALKEKNATREQTECVIPDLRLEREKRK